MSGIELLGNLRELLRVSETFRPTNSEIRLKKGISWEAAIQQFSCYFKAGCLTINMIHVLASDRSGRLARM